MLLVHDRRAVGMATERNGVGALGSRSDVEVSAGVKIGDRATIDYHVAAGEGEVEFSVGGDGGFDLVTTEHGLRNLVDRTQETLRAVQSAVACNDEGSAPA